VCHSDQNSNPNPEGKTHPDHRIALIHTQHSGCASPKGNGNRWRDTGDGGMEGRRD